MTTKLDCDPVRSWLHILVADHARELVLVPVGGREHAIVAVLYLWLDQLCACLHIAMDIGI